MLVPVTRSFILPFLCIFRLKIKLSFIYNRQNLFYLLGLPVAAIEPVPESSISRVEKRTTEEKERWLKMGVKAILDGKLGVLLLSGGQVC